MSDDTIRSPAEYALYWLAVNRPEVMEDAWRSMRTSAMLANDRISRQDVRDMLEDHIDRTLGRQVLGQADSR